MPIRPDLRPFYGRTWRAVTRPRILARAGNKCEQCGKPNSTLVYVHTPSAAAGQYWTFKLNPVRLQRWTYCIFRGGGNFVLFPGQQRGVRRIRVVLTVAHLNHMSGDDRDDNLRALCQWCHLNYDKLHHAQTRAARKDSARPLLSA